MKLVAPLLCVALLASAQWLKIPTPGIPRTPDGKPNLTAPAPRRADGKPDISGLWQGSGKHLQDIAADLKPGDVPYQPATEALFKQHQQGIGNINDPAAHCIPTLPKLNVLPYPFKIVEQPGMTLILYEGFTTFRQIFTDGRALPKDPQPAWLGYSVGRWDGDDFVIDTIGINPASWLDNAGRTHSDAMHLIERLHRIDFGHMEMRVTIDDPKAYTRPWTVVESARFVPDTEILEYICSENNKALEHLR